MSLGKDTAEVIEVIYDSFTRSGEASETLPIDNCFNRILASHIYSNEDLPHFDRATMDGYAVIAADVAGAEKDKPTKLKILGEVFMSEGTEHIVTPGTAVYVPTGGIIPKGADAVVMLESCLAEGEFLFVYEGVGSGINMVVKGQDTKAGSLVINRMTVLGSKEISVLATLGITNVAVYKKLTCGVVVTGDEIVSMETPVDYSKTKIRDVNSHTSKSLIEKWGGQYKFYGIVKDEEALIREVVTKAHNECDLVIITGGSSVGKKDNSYRVIKSFDGAEFLTSRIAVRPGKPTIIAKCGSKAIIGLPGHTVSAYFIMMLIVRHVFRALSGLKPDIMPHLSASLSDDIESNPEKDEYFAVKLHILPDKVLAEPYPIRSSLIALLAGTNGFVKVPKGCGFMNKEASVEVYLFENP